MLTVLAAPAIALSTAPLLTLKAAAIWPELSNWRMLCQRLPLPLIVGGACHATFSSAAAWIASYSSGATTPRKFAFWMIWTFGMCLTELGSTLIGIGVEPCP